MNTACQYIYNIIRRFLPETRCYGLKAAMLRLCGAKVGKNVRICSSAMIFGNGELEIGDGTWIGEQCFIKATSPAKIMIGSNCDIAPRVTMMTGTHEIDPTGDHVAGKGSSKSISIGDGCGFCAKSVILAGISLASKTLVAAGAVVTKDVDEPGTLIGGVPAKFLRKL